MSSTKLDWQRALVTMSATVTSAVVIVAVYWMRSVFIPIVLAIFLTYVLAPLVRFAQRWRLGRLPAVVLVAGVALAVFLGTTAVLAQQMSGLSESLAENKDRIIGKLAQARAAIVGDGESRWGKMLGEFEQAVAPRHPPADGAASVVVEPVGSDWLSRFDGILGPLTETFGQVAFAFILVVFMLLAREDLQDRVLRLLGDDRMTDATRATGEASGRISRYLLSQLVLNVGFGLLCAVGLFAMGVPYALLWGFIAFLMRYVPYLGTWVGVVLPAGFSFAISEGWWQPVGVIALFLGLEVISNNLIEPRLYGTSLGVSEVALLVSAVVWSFLWGPLGLILSGPITTSLLAIGKYLPAFRFLYILLGTEPPLTPPVSFFQRLMARNQDEALRVVTAAVPVANPEAVFDDVVVPALSLLVQARRDGAFDGDEEKRTLTITREVVEELGHEVRGRGERAAVGGRRLRMLCCPASEEAERVSLDVLVALLPENRWEVRVTAVDTLTSELLDGAAAFAPQVVVVASLPPNGLAHVRYLCKRLRGRLPGTYVLVGRWGEADAATVTASVADTGASAVATSLLEARNQLAAYAPVFSDTSSESVLPSLGGPLIGTPPATAVGHHTSSDV
ncbi:MAG: AI-2E family transporter [Fimbriiglobus sp.]|jgi:predicted PurR-regulated permease PerM|nr:AI-2E family transporter [Fimbriiglobus sp.]